MKSHCLNMPKHHRHMYGSVWSKPICLSTSLKSPPRIKYYAGFSVLTFQSKSFLFSFLLNTKSNFFSLLWNDLFTFMPQASPLRLLITWSFNILDCLFWQAPKDQKRLAIHGEEVAFYLWYKAGQTHTSGVLAVQSTLDILRQACQNISLNSNWCAYWSKLWWKEALLWSGFQQ